jgi:glycosyltransferase involved in cell wall biosynthesis
VAGQSYPDQRTSRHRRRQHRRRPGDRLKPIAPSLTLLISEPDRGIYDALNKGIARASGEVIGFLHADDLYADPQVLARIAAAFADPAVDAVYGDLVYVSQADTDHG